MNIEHLHLEFISIDGYRNKYLTSLVRIYLNRWL